MYEECLRMPFIIRYPGHIKPGSTANAMTLNVDFAPTLLDFAGLDAPPEVQGRSFRPVLEGNTPADWRKSMYYRYYHYPEHHRVQPHYGVRTERYKLIFFNRIKEWELFDLEKYPHEVKNVYADAVYQPIVKELKTELARLRKHYDDNGQYSDLE